MLSLLLLCTFVVALASFPPLSIYKTPNALIGYEIEINGAQWKANVKAYTDVLRSGSLGTTRSGEPAAQVVAQGLRRSLTLVAIALAVATPLGALKGLWDFAQLRRRGVALGPVVTSAMQSLPDFWIVLILQFVAGWLWRTFDWRPFPATWTPAEPTGSLIVPVIALSLIPLAYIARVTCTALSNVYEQHYVRTARAKGVTELTITLKHAARNVAVQMLDGFAAILPVLFANLLIIEHLFGYPGLTPLLQGAVNMTASYTIHAQLYGVTRSSADMPVLVLSGISLGLLFWFFHLLLNLLRRIADPRLKEREQA